MEQLQELETIRLIGLSLPHKTSNTNGQSAKDCGELWERFIKGNYAAKIPDKLSSEIYAVYHAYEGDHTKPYAYFIGCKVKAETEVPEDLDAITIPAATFQKLTAKGKMPDCVASKWREIWTGSIPRAYQADFEVYDARSQDWNNAEVDIFVSITS